MKEFESHRSENCPFVNLPSSKKGHFGEGVTAEDMPKLRWLKPKLVAQVAFTEWTNYGLLRHATYLGLREDKDPTEVVREAPPRNVKEGAKRRKAPSVFSRGYVLLRSFG